MSLFCGPICFFFEEGGGLSILALTYLISYLTFFSSSIADKERKMRVWEMQCRLDLVIITVDGWTDVVVVAEAVNFFSTFHSWVGVLVSLFYYYYYYLLFSWGKGFDEQLID